MAVERIDQTWGIGAVGAGVRRLAAIMIADVAGYSRMMGLNERATHARVQRIQREIIEPTIVEHRGRLIKQQGDGFLTIFASPVDCVRCAIVIQQSVMGLNLELELPHDQWVRFRIGINLGDVIVEPNDIYGDGVNVAARLEQLCEPGGIYISGGVYEQIRYKLVCGYQSLGDRKVKNILDPVPIYRVLPDPASIAAATRHHHLRLMLLGVAGIIVLGAGGWLLAWHYERQVVNLREPTRAPTTESRSIPPLPQSEPQSTVKPPQQAVVTPRPAPSPPIEATQVPTKVILPPPIEEPEMVSIGGGTFDMGSNENASERPVHKVTVSPFLLAKYPITVHQWLDCVQAQGCDYVPKGYDDAPMSNVSWNDAQQYIAWLSKKTQHTYRLPSEAEWEYAARGGTTTRYWWGNSLQPGYVVCKDCGGDATLPKKVGSLRPNPFGLYDIGGGVSEWVDDCWFKDYVGAPSDGKARLTPNCQEHVLRGGAWSNDSSYVRSASRNNYDAPVRYPTHGFRVAHTP